MNAPPGLTDLSDALERGGVPAALRFLNARTPHRFTGVYRYDGDTLRNEYLFDRSAPEATRGEDVAMVDAYCATVGQQRKTLEFADIRTDGRLAVKPGSPVISYCGALIRTDQDQPYGTLCHFDVLPCEQRSSDIPLLEGAAPLIYAAIQRRGERGAAYPLLANDDAAS